MEDIKICNSDLGKERCLPIGLIFQLLNKYLLSACYIPVMVLETGNIMVRIKINTVGFFFYGDRYHLMGEDSIQITTTISIKFTTTVVATK